MGPGAGSNATVTVCKNAFEGGGGAGETAITVTLTGSPGSIATYYNSSVNFNTGDYINLYVDISGETLDTLSVQVYCL